MSVEIFVSGSKLVWESGSVRYTTLGATPTSIPSGFDSQPSGKIWVATQDRFLWYSDENGDTRFVKGIDRGSAGSVPNGKIFANRGTCPTVNSPSQDLWWVSSGSYNSVRAENVNQPIHSTLTLYYFVSFDDLDGYILGTLSEPVDTDVSASGLAIASYNDCGGSAVGGASGMTLAIPAGSLVASSSIFNLLAGNSYLFTDVQPGINGNNRNDGDTFCISNDSLTLILDPSITGSCVQISPGTGEQLCGEECIPGSSTPSEACDPSTGCICNPTPEYDSGTMTYTHYCYDPAEGGGSGGGPCGASCENDAQCGSSCPVCDTGICVGIEPI